MRRLGLGLALLCLAFGTVTASAQDKYPSKPVKIVVPYAPGGATDITSRMFGEQLKKILGQPFVVENKPGAFGILAIEEMARSKPDGYTLMIGNVLDQRDHAGAVPEEVQDQLRARTWWRSRGSSTSIRRSWSRRPTNFDVKTVPELIDYAKKNPGKVRYSSAGVGSFPHYDMEFFASARATST